MADPITAAVSAIATYVSGAFAATAAGTATLAQTATVIGVNLAASAAVNAAATALLQPNTGAEGSPLEWRADPTAGVPFALGRVAAAGRIVHRDEWGADNRYQSIWTVCSGGGPIQQIEGFYADDVAVSFGANGAASTGPYADKMWLQTKLGASSDTALAQTGLDAATPGYEGWNASKALPYRASCQLTLYQDSKFKSYPSGEPRTRLTLKGIKLYDPRLDSTVPGGSGSHRWGTPSTYAYSDNAALLALNWAMGLYEGSRLVGGIGAGSAGVHLPAFMEWANVCDANGWTASAYPSSLDDRHQVLLGLMQAGGARYARFAGKISCIVSAPKSSVVTLSVEDTAGPFEIATNADRLEKINTLVPTCRMESHNWEDVPQDEISVAAYVTADGGVIDRDLTYLYVALHADGSNRDQIAELAAYAILDSREPFSGTVPLKPWAMQIEPGDVFTITEPGFLLDGVELKCLTRSFDPMTNIVRVSFISESAGKHDFALGRTNTAPVPATLTVPDIYDVPPPAIDVWSATAGTGKQPTIVVTGSADQDNARAFIVEYRTEIDPSTGSAWADDDAGWRVFGQYDIATEGVVLTGLEPETAYEVAVKYVSQFGVIGERRVLGAITTGGLTATDATIPSEKIDAARDAINAARGELTENLEEANRTLEYAVTGLTQDAQRALQDARLGAQVSLLNRLTDPLFETGVDGWNAVGGAVLSVAGSPRALQAVWNIAEAGRPGAQYLQWPVKWRVSEGDSVQVGAEVGLFGVSSDIVLEAVWIDAAGDALSSTEIATGSSGRLEGVAQAPADSAEVTIRMAPVASEAGMGGFLVRRPLAASALPGQATVDAFTAPENELVARLDRLERVVGNIAESSRTLQVETRSGRASIRTNAQAIVTESEARTQLGVSLNTTLQNNYLTAAQVGQTYLAISGLEDAFAGIDVGVNATLAGVIQTVNDLPADILTEAAAAQTFVAFANLEQAVSEIDLTANAAFSAIYTTVNDLPADILTEAAAAQTFVAFANLEQAVSEIDLTANAAFSAIYTTVNDLPADILTEAEANQTFLAIADLQQSVAGIDLSANAAFAATVTKVDGLPDTVYSQAAADAKFLASANLSTALSAIDFTTYASFNNNTSRVVRAASAPYIPDYKAGDIWINTSSGELRVHNGSGWDSTTLATLAYSNANFRTQSQVDSQISSFNFAALSYFNEMNAQVEVNATAISDLEDSAAQLNIVVAASGSTPATAELISGGGGSAVNLSATEIVLKTNTGGTLKTALKGVDGNVLIPNTLLLGESGNITTPVVSGRFIRFGVIDGAMRFEAFDGSDYAISCNLSTGVFEINGANLTNASVGAEKIPLREITAPNAATTTTFGPWVAGEYAQLGNVRGWALQHLICPLDDVVGGARLDIDWDYDFSFQGKAAQFFTWWERVYLLPVSSGLPGYRQSTGLINSRLCEQGAGNTNNTAISPTAINANKWLAFPRGGSKQIVLPADAGSVAYRIILQLVLDRDEIDHSSGNQNGILNPNPPYQYAFESCDLRATALKR